MVFSPVAAVISLMISDCMFCDFKDGSFLEMVMYHFRIRLFSEDAFNFAVDIPTKYVFFTLFIVFSIGLLLYLEVISMPFRHSRCDERYIASDRDVN